MKDISLILFPDLLNRLKGPLAILAVALVLIIAISIYLTKKAIENQGNTRSDEND